MSGPDNLQGALARLENDSGWEGIVHQKEITPELRIKLSIALSLKRIADCFDGTTTSTGIHEMIGDIAYPQR